MKNLSLYILVGALALLCSTATAQQSYAVIANTSVGADQLSRTEVADVFLGKMTIVGGSAVKLFILSPENEVSGVFFDKVLGTTANKFNQTWLRNAFSGGGATPTRLASSAELIRAVAGTPGAIGYVAKSAAASASGCKVLYTE